MSGSALSPLAHALLWNRATDHLWVIEAVTSDGEVDMPRFKR